MFKKGQNPWNKGIKGIYHHSDETKQKIIETANRNWLDKKYREKTLEKMKNTIVSTGGYKSWNRGKHGVQDYSGNGKKISKALKGRKLSKEHKRNMGIAQKKLWSDEVVIVQQQKDTSFLGHSAITDFPFKHFLN